MRRQHHVRRRAQRVVGGHRLSREDVDGRAGKLAGGERVGQGRLVHDPTTRDIEDEGTGFGGLELGAADQVARLRR